MENVHVISENDGNSASIVSNNQLNQNDFITCTSNESNRPIYCRRTINR